MNSITVVGWWKWVERSIHTGSFSVDKRELADKVVTKVDSTNISNSLCSSRLDRRSEKNEQVRMKIKIATNKRHLYHVFY